MQYTIYPSSPPPPTPVKKFAEIEGMFETFLRQSFLRFIKFLKVNNNGYYLYVCKVKVNEIYIIAKKTGWLWYE